MKFNLFVGVKSNNFEMCTTYTLMIYGYHHQQHLR